MAAQNRIAELLRDEHSASGALMEQLGNLIERHPPSDPPDIGAHEVQRLLNELSVAVGSDLLRHFELEEKFLLRYLVDLGDRDLGQSLVEEHEFFRPIIRRLKQLLDEVRAASFNPETWGEFRSLGRELSVNLLMHIEKEEMGLVPILEEFMDADDAERIFEEHMALP